MDRPTNPTQVLQRYLNVAHDAMRWKLDGLSEYDLRRPLTPTGTNVLGIVKHVAWVELDYFGLVFDRPHDLPRTDNADEANADMYASAEESVADILDLFGRAQTQATETIDALGLEAEGHVPWWGDVNPVNVQWICVHMVAEIHRHLGQIDILREGIDGAVGYRDGSENMPEGGPDYWSGYVAELERIARAASD